MLIALTFVGIDRIWICSMAQRKQQLFEPPDVGTAGQLSDGLFRLNQHRLQPWEAGMGAIESTQMGDGYVTGCECGAHEGVPSLPHSGAEHDAYLTTSGIRTVRQPRMGSAGTISSEGS